MSHSMDGVDSSSVPRFTPAVKKRSLYSRGFLFLLFTLAFVAGNLVLQKSSHLIPSSSLVVVFFVFVFLYLLSKKFIVFKQRYVSYGVLLLIISSGFYFGYISAWLQASKHLKHALAADVMSQDVQLPGCISTLPQKKAGFSRFIIEPIAESHSEFSNLRRIRVSANLKQLPNADFTIDFKAGDCWLWNLRLKTNRGLRNQHGFDYEKWLYLQGIGATAYLRAAPQKLDLQKYSWLAYRANIAQKIKQALPENSPINALILGLSLGIRDDISTEQWEVLQNTGTSHLLAISGLHIGIAALFGFYFGKILYFFLAKTYLSKIAQGVLPLHVALAISMLFAVFYSAMAGFSVSTQRACIMLLTVSICSFGAKKYKANSVLCLALLAVLLIDPRASLSAGTWLSFLAVATLLLLIKSEKNLQRTKVSFITSKLANLKQAAKLQFFLVLFLSVPVALVFFKVSVISPLVNFVLIPIFAFSVVPMLLTALLLIKINSEFSFLLINWQHEWLSFLWSMLERLSDFPMAHYNLQLGFESAMFMSILLLVLIFPKGVLPKKYAFILLGPFLLGFSENNIKPQELEMTVYDVGQGLSVFLQTANHQLLYDTGPAFRSGSSAAERVIKPWLQAKNLTSLSAMVISHSDNDHAGGIELIRHAFKPELIFSPGADSIVNSKECEAGYSWNWDGVDFEFLYPFDNTLSKNTNNYSCVLRVSLHGRTILLTGDIEKEAEKTLLNVYANLHSDIVFVPHHGSRTSSTPAFVQAIEPQIAIIPAGFANRWRFPKPDILLRWQNSSQEVYTISNTGELNLHINSKGEISQSSWISRKCRYWHQDCKN